MTDILNHGHRLKSLTKRSILGTDYTIKVVDYENEIYFKENGCDGYCDDAEKVICICNLETHPEYKNESAHTCEFEEKSTLRHEIIHAYLNEAGLNASALPSPSAWSKNEEMVDFFAIQLPKIAETCQSLNCL